MFTLGEIFIIYISYTVTIFGSIITWVFLQEGDVYLALLLLLFLSLFYFISASYRYSNNFKQVILKEWAAKEHLDEQVSANKKIMEQKDALDYQAHYDTLTGLPNRVLFQDRLIQGIENAKRSSTKLAVCFMDLDNFKIINDSLGHDVGDSVLKAVTTRLNSITRSCDTVSRWGGDEFIMIMEVIHTPEDVSAIAKKILSSLEEPFLINDRTLYVTISIGISLYPDDDSSGENLVKYADSAMYKAKDEGRNNYLFYSNDMTKKALSRVMMEASIKKAIQNKEFIVYYQPQIDSQNNKLIGMEALVRWIDPVMGLISPDKFIPLAEETGMIVEIDKLVMDIAMEQFSQWYNSGYNPGVLSLNLAIKDLEQKNCLKVLKDKIDKFNLDYKYIELELTESDIMHNPEESINTLNKISEYGVKIAIDDFGTGYSSLAYLKKLPISKLKIDKSFIDDIPYNEDSNSIVKAIIAMADSLSLNLIAEGVENKIQKDYLLDNGCTNIQGYYYAKPMPWDEMSKFMKENN